MVQILLREDEQDFASNLKEIIEIDLVVADLFIKKDGQFEKTRWPDADLNGAQDNWQRHSYQGHLRQVQSD